MNFVFIIHIYILVRYVPKYIKIRVTNIHIYQLEAK